MKWYQKLALRAVKIAGVHPRDPALVEWLTGGKPTASGANVTADTALTVAAVFSAVRVLSESVAMLPLHVYKRLAGGGRERDTGHPLYRLLNERPNRWQTPFEFFELLMTHLSLRGNFYAYKVYDFAGAVQELLSLHPDRVTPFWIEEGVPGYRYQPLKGAMRVFLHHEVFHVRGLPAPDGLAGLSPITLHRETVGLAMAQQEYGARFIANDATPGGVIHAPGVLKDETIATFRKYWEQHHKGVANANKIAILEAGMEFKQITITPEDAQYIESRKFSVNDIARIFRVPPHMIGDLERSTFNNIEHQSLGFVVFSLAPTLARIEQAAKRDLFNDAQRVTHFAEFLVAALLRGDQKAKALYYKTGVLTGYFTRNEVRQWENLNPLDGLDEPLTPLNMGDAQGDGLGDDVGSPDPDKENIDAP